MKNLKFLFSFFRVFLPKWLVDLLQRPFVVSFEEQPCTRVRQRYGLVQTRNNELVSTYQANFQNLSCLQGVNQGFYWSYEELSNVVNLLRDDCFDGLVFSLGYNTDNSQIIFIAREVDYINETNYAESTRTDGKIYWSIASSSTEPPVLPIPPANP